MGKSKRGEHEITREQRLVKENQALKRENQRLRKQLARAELNRYENIKETVEEHERTSGSTTTKDLLDALKNEWACRAENCTGYLEIILFNKLSDTYYFRSCTDCKNRTKTQKYDPKSVKGIIKK